MHSFGLAISGVAVAVPRVCWFNTATEGYSSRLRSTNLSTARSTVLPNSLAKRCADFSNPTLNPKLSTRQSKPTQAAAVSAALDLGFCIFA